MCGIIGFTGNIQAKNIIIDGLERLEYRGYDSAGLALLNNGRINVMKKTGKIVWKIIVSIPVYMREK